MKKNRGVFAASFQTSDFDDHDGLMVIMEDEFLFVTDGISLVFGKKIWIPVIISIVIIAVGLYFLSEFLFGAFILVSILGVMIAIVTKIIRFKLGEKKRKQDKFKELKRAIVSGYSHFLDDFKEHKKYKWKDIDTIAFSCEGEDNTPYLGFITKTGSMYECEINTKYGGKFYGSRNEILSEMIDLLKNIVSEKLVVGKT